jgi:hypothetical protein
VVCADPSARDARDVDDEGSDAGRLPHDLHKTRVFL